ncbi:MAG: hypothetical protein MUC73_07910 [Cyclobacteriaceae bacterium]|nr:hypothetical protein [Cyclobacteriaceae bacterium]
MLSYFRINDPYRLLVLLALLILIWLPMFIDTPLLTIPEIKSFVVGEKVSEGFDLYSELIDPTPPLASWFYGIADWVFGRNITVRHIMSFIILFMQSAFLGIVLISKKAFPENTYIPSLIFSLLTLISFDMLSLTADLAAFGFLLLALNTLLTELEFRSDHDETVFNLGLFISFASLLNFSYSLYLPGFILILIFFTRNMLRKYLLMLIGFLLPHLLLVVIFYLKGDASALWQHFYRPNLSFPNESLISIKSLFILGAIPMLYLVISIVMLNRKAHLTKYQSQVMQSMWLWMFIALIQVYFTPDFRPQSLLPLLPPLCFFITHFLLLIRRKKFTNLNAVILIAGMTTMLYLTRYEKISSVDFNELIAGKPSLSISNKRILVLQDEPELYVSNSASPAFTDWKLTQAIFDHPEYYENILLVNRIIAKDQPELIIDPEYRFQKFVDRVPELKKQYKRNSDGTWNLTRN